MNTDQNLLFGVLALELDFIDVQQFAEVCCAWAAHKEKGLADLLVERGWIGADERNEVQRLMDRKVRRKLGDVRRVLGDLANPQVRDVMHGVGDAAVDQTLSQLEPVPGFVRVSETAELPQGELSHYTLSRVHDQGGLGRVWLAFDKNLRRDVALKEIRPDRKASQESLGRFVREAQITGQLEHPNIVPVYELARDEERTYPFYTMRFVHGQSMGDAVDAYHEKRRAGNPAGLEFRRLLQAFVSVCHATAYAHSRRVIHRDLKPSNVMLGSYGEVVVLDWGLAKVLDKPETLPEKQDPVTPLDGTTDSARADPGHARLHAPEQALGKHDQIDALTDVYGLGSILYRILTGERPHPGRDSQERMRHAAEEPTPAPRVVDPRVPGPLNAICRKAMSRNRLDRYLSATALADDVQRWLADEPVSTYRDPWHVRTARWARRHRQLAASIAAVVVLTAVAATTAAVLINQARQEAIAAQVKEAEATRAAFGWFQEAQRTIDVMATGVSNVLQNLPGTDTLRVGLLQNAASFYERYSAQKPSDRLAKLERGHTLMRLGDIRRRVGAYAEAAQAYQDCATGLQRTRQRAPGGPRCPLGSGGLLAQDRGRAGRSRQVRGRAQDLGGGSGATGPSSTIPQPAAARDRIEDQPRLAGAGLQGFAASRAVVPPGVGTSPAASRSGRAEKHRALEDLEQLALIQSLLGGILSRARSHEEAIRFLQAALDNQERLTEAKSDQPSYWEGLAFAELTLAQRFCLFSPHSMESTSTPNASSPHSATRWSPTLHSSSSANSMPQTIDVPSLETIVLMRIDWGSLSRLMRWW